MRVLVIAQMILVLTLSSSGAENPFVGIWELNIGKSKPDPSSSPVRTLAVKYVLDDGAVLKAWLTIDGVPSAHPTPYDGKEHEYGGTSALLPTHIVATAKGAILETFFKRDGMKVGTRKNTLSADGRSMTVITEGTKPNGTKYRSVLVFEKQ
jgi:hypothetical protein